MEERTITLENAYFRNVLRIIEGLSWKLPRPTHASEKPGSSVTQYFFHQPIRTNVILNRKETSPCLPDLIRLLALSEAATY
jgi:hypothetical protein